MYSDFQTERFEHIKADSVQIDNFKGGYHNEGRLDVWIESTSVGKRFLSQLTTQGSKSPARTGVYTKHCYILREKSSGSYFFLDINDNGIWLFNDRFFGSENYRVDESARLQQWLGGTV
jgi:hypothetical protein